MNILESTLFSLHNFEGPLDYLLHLIQRGEIDICDVPLQLVTEQFLEKHWENDDDLLLDKGAEFVGTTSILVWLKSQRLLPQEQTSSDDPLEIDPRFEIIHQLIDYCRFKKAAQMLQKKEQEQALCHYRAPPAEEIPRPLGLESISLEDLAQLFQNVLSKATSSTGKIYEEAFRVADGMKQLKEMSANCLTIPFKLLFHPGLCREELIVYFLALLELMKTGFLAVVVDSSGSPMIAKGADDSPIF